MRFTPTILDGVYIVDLDPRSDDRGFFARFFCAEEFAEHGLTVPSEQGNISLTHQSGTVRGVHWQDGDDAEAKFIRCVRGALFDVAVDVRPDSPTYLQHVGVELTAENRRAVYVGEGFGHAYQTLLPDTEALYMVSAPYAPDAERGLRPTDPALAIDWPTDITDLSVKDSSWDLLTT